MKKNIFIAGLSCLIIGIACKKELIEKNNFFQFTDTSKVSFVKVFIATVNASNNYVYADNLPLTGSRLSLGSIFPVNLGYAAISPGSRSISIKDTLSSSTQVPVTFNQNFETGKYYSIFIYDTITNVKYKVVPDNFIIPADTSAQLRFANMIYSKSLVPNVDVFSKKLNMNIFTNITIGTVTNFISFPSKKADSLFIQETGTTNRLAGMGFTPGAQRSYTLVFNGSYGVLKGGTKRSLTFYTNQ